MPPPSTPPRFVKSAFGKVFLCLEKALQNDRQTDKCPSSLAFENAGRNPYYCVDGSMLDAWQYVPKDLIMVSWMNGRSDINTTNWLMEHGFRCLAGGYYNYPDLSRDIIWRDACKANPKSLGMMFTTWGGT